MCVVVRYGFVFIHAILQLQVRFASRRGGSEEILYSHFSSVTLSSQLDQAVVVQSRK